MENKKGRRARYVTEERFGKFINNEFYHMKLKVNFLIVVGLATLGAAIARLFFG